MTLEVLDDAIYLALSLGSIEWHSAGTGDNMPGIPVFRFVRDRCTYGARLDMWRGLAQYDLPNEVWSAWFRGLPRTRQWLMQQNMMTLSIKDDGNRMAEFAGIAYTAFVDHSNLPPDMRIEYEGGELHKEAWKDVWDEFRQIGLTVTDRDQRGWTVTDDVS